MRTYKSGPVMPVPVYLTPEGKHKFEQELAQLEAQLPELRAEARRTKEYGDLSENAEYHAAKHKLRRANSRILLLKHKLARAEIITKGTSQTIRMGAKVTLKTSGREVVYEILGVDESDPSQGKISHHSPLGEALLGRVVGDKVSVATPKGKTDYLIKKIA